MKSNQDIYLDGGILLNLVATRRCDEILSALPYQCRTLDNIVAERFTIVNTSAQVGDDATKSSIEYDLSTVSSLQICQFDILPHIVELVRFAVRFPDGYARLLSSVVVSGAALATDDNCVRQILNDIGLDIKLLDTVAILQQWQIALKKEDHDVGVIIHDIETYAQFEVPQKHPQREWWNKIRQQAE